MLTISAGFLSWAFDSDGGASRRRTWSAWSPLRPWATPNSTRVPGLSVATPSGRADDRTYTSPPSSLERQPKPFSTSYPFTLPLGTGPPPPCRRPYAGRLVVPVKPTGVAAPTAHRFVCGRPAGTLVPGG